MPNFKRLLLCLLVALSVALLAGAISRELLLLAGLYLILSVIAINELANDR